MIGNKIKSFLIQMFIDYVVHFCLVITAVIFSIVLTKTFGASDELAIILATILIFVFYLLYFSKWRKKRSQKNCLDEIFKRVPQKLNKRGFAIEEITEKEWIISQGKEE